ncbi:MAG: peptidylprolyl isomerase [Methyloligellaceae bacterium]
MKIIIRATIGLFALFILVAQAPNKIIAKVNGISITESEFKLAEEELGAQLQQVPAEQRRVLLLEYLIENHILAAAAKENKLQDSDDFKARMDYFRLRAMRDSFYQKNVRAGISDDEVKSFFDQQIGNVKPETEVHARHILVKTEDEAKTIKKEIDGGADFVKLAKEKSTGPSGPQGGDLGYFTRGRMVPEFEQAAFGLKSGSVSEPIKTQFGWHLIKVEDIRTKPLPTLDMLKDRIVQTLMQQKAQQVVGGMRQGAKVEVLDSELKKLHEELRGSFGG